MRTLTRFVAVLVFAGVVLTVSGCCMFRSGCGGNRRGGCGGGGRCTTIQPLCQGCGHIKDSAACCQPGAVKCTKCGMVKGSPGCCKGL
jgi:hypothetical protein